MSDITLFGAEWCPSCKLLKKQLETKNIIFKYADADEKENATLLANIGVRSIPFIIKDGEYNFTPTISDFQ